jgi:hypothetical protein
VVAFVGRPGGLGEPSAAAILDPNLDHPRRAENCGEYPSRRRSYLFIDPAGSAGRGAMGRRSDGAPCFVDELGEASEDCGEAREEAGARDRRAARSRQTNAADHNHLISRDGPPGSGVRGHGGSRRACSPRPSPDSARFPRRGEGRRVGREPPRRRFVPGSYPLCPDRPGMGRREPSRDKTALTMSAIGGPMRLRRGGQPRR